MFFADQRRVWKVGEVAGRSYAELSELFERHRLPRGTPILLDDTMRPVEPLTSWFRAMGLAGRDAKTMKAYAYTALMLFNFLATRGRDFASASEADLLEFRLWRRERTAPPPIKSFAGFLRQDLGAVLAGLTLDYSSGRVEGHVNRLKTLKRQMFNRAGLPLLRKRVLLA